MERNPVWKQENMQETASQTIQSCRSREPEAPCQLACIAPFQAKIVWNFQVPKQRDQILIAIQQSVQFYLCVPGMTYNKNITQMFQLGLSLFLELPYKLRGLVSLLVRTGQAETEQV